MNTIQLKLSDITIEHPLRQGENHGRLKALTHDVERSGVREAITVYQDGGRYILLSGSRRLRAARSAGLSEITCTVEDRPEGEQLAYAARRALSQEGLRPVDQMMAVMNLHALSSGESAEDLLKAYKRLAKDDSKPDEEAQGDPAIRNGLRTILESVGIWPVDGFLQNVVRLHRLKPELFTLHQLGELDFDQAAELGKIKDPQQRAELTSRASAGELTALQIKRIVKQTREMEKESGGGKEEEGDSEGASGGDDSGEENTDLSEAEQTLARRIDRMPEQRRPEARKHLRSLLGMFRQD